MRSFAPIAALFFLGIFCLASGSYAEDDLVLDRHPAETVLTKSTTLVLNPPQLNESDFEVVWEGTPLEGVEAQIVPQSLQWVRTQEVLVLPRARLHIRVAGPATGTAKHHGAFQAFESNASQSHAEVPVALLGDKASWVELTLQRPQAALQQGKLRIQFKSPRPAEQRVHLDASCSPFRLQLQKAQLQPHSWAFLGCRLVYTQRETRLVPSLELLVFWDGVGEKIQVGGVPSESTLPGVWSLRLRSEPGILRLASVQHPTQNLEFTYRLRPELHLGSFGFGIGPYGYRYTSASGKDNVNQVAGVATFYGSIFFNHYMRAVLFSILPVHQKLFNDTGVYLLVEQARVLDNRLSVNFLLGGHGILFPYDGANYFRFSFPQGIELILRDFPSRRQNMTFGAFLYPFAGERSYYNIWLRWAMGPYFGELNYIKWDEIVRSGTLVGAQLWGVSFGMPLFEFL